MDHRVSIHLRPRRGRLVVPRSLPAILAVLIVLAMVPGRAGAQEATMPTVSDSDELLVNADFEDGDTGWYVEGGTTIERREPHGGAWALHLPIGGGYADQHVDI